MHNLIIFPSFILLFPFFTFFKDLPREIIGKWQYPSKTDMFFSISQSNSLSFLFYTEGFSSHPSSSHFLIKNTQSYASPPSFPTYSNCTTSSQQVHCYLWSFNVSIIILTDNVNRIISISVKSSSTLPVRGVDFRFHHRTLTLIILSGCPCACTHDRCPVWPAGAKNSRQFCMKIVKFREMQICVLFCFDTSSSW